IDSVNRHRTAMRRMLFPPLRRPLGRHPSGSGRGVMVRHGQPDCRRPEHRLCCRPSEEDRLSLDYLVARIGQLLLIVFIAVTINFLIPRAIPGDPIEAALQTRIAMTGSTDVNVQEVARVYRAKFGLDKPLWQQYLNYWGDILHLERGVSLVDFPQPVISKVRGALPWTLGLLGMSTVIDFSLGTLLGALGAWPRT